MIGPSIIIAAVIVLMWLDGAFPKALAAYERRTDALQVLQGDDHG